MQQLILNKLSVFQQQGINIFELIRHMVQGIVKQGVFVQPRIGNIYIGRKSHLTHHGIHGTQHQKRKEEGKNKGKQDRDKPCKKQGPQGGKMGGKQLGRRNIKGNLRPPFRGESIGFGAGKQSLCVFFRGLCVIPLRLNILPGTPEELILETDGGRIGGLAVVLGTAFEVGNGQRKCDKL